ncbi:sodium-dependent transporter bedraggled isoform X1 [Bicyclus anynana]|uniref:Sodium-dependent transporter bedraggled isoform X1 n=2 Tax=Bicyclus anynana TaxID=110368 RepID=A0A6J1N3C4_BICAN|nr:sodium-dependent transporter bedraggled isoform X1 [Bicyclus anynana]
MYIWYKFLYYSYLGFTQKHAGYDLGYAIKMEVVNMEEGRYEQTDCLPGSSADSDASSSIFESNDSSEPISDIDKPSDEEDLREDLQKNIPSFYKTDSNASQSINITDDEEFQATALCQFMDILNDLDEVLDKSLLACLDDGTKSFDSDDDDLICKIKECIAGAEDSVSQSSVDDTTQVVMGPIAQTSQSTEEVDITHSDLSLPRLNFGRSKSYTDLPRSNSDISALSLERANTVDDSLRNSMRRLDPIVLPAISTQESSQASCEPLTLPVILFVEHHVNMRPTSAPIQLQVSAANVSSDGPSGPLIVGRRTLLMNRALSLPSPGDSDVTAIDWSERNASRNVARSASGSSSSSGSLIGVVPITPSAFTTSEDRNEENEVPPFGVWPHRLSAMLACLSCTVGIFNISRFAIFSVHFGASFIIQFFMLSLIIGIPLFTLHLCLGQVLEAGPVDMWRISPIFQGVGVSLLLTQAVIGMYSIIGLSWIFVYFRDSFINSDDRYKWALPHEFSFEDMNHKNSTIRIQETLPQYFHGEVLQRNLNSNSFGTIKFQVAFNLAVVWMIVFVSLSKGLRSYGKAVYMLIFLPICGTLVLCTKLLTLIPYDAVTNIFSETEWGEFFINSNSWAAAAQETFLTWGLLGACVMQLTSHKDVKNKTNVMLQKESACIVAFTFAVLLLGSFLANTCVQILKNHGFHFVPSSFETIKSSQFLWPMSEPMPGNTVSTPVRYMGHYGSLVGVTVWKTGNTVRTLSGWQPLQLATQIVPATLAVLPANVLSPAWAVIFYFILIMFGIAQQLAIWHCVITGVMAINARALRVWETTITFLSCVFGLAVGLLLCTDAGIKIVHFIDYVWVGSWWQCVVQVALAVGVFVVRGRPYSPDAVVAALYSARSRLSATLAALLSFTWTVVLPVLLCAICVMDFRVGQQRQLYTWRKPIGYWAIWARQAGVALQQAALLLVPLAAFVQTWRYISKGPPDILERVQNLYRPRMNEAGETVPPTNPVRDAPVLEPAPDPPPKYTPPPSYSTATGARLLNTLRRSFRTLRRITSSRAESQHDDTSQIPITLSESIDRQSHTSAVPTLTVTDETDSTRTIHTHPNTSASTHQLNRNRPTSSRNSLTLTRDFLRRSFVRKSDSAKSIRSSLRRSFKYGGGLTTSHEHLVRDVEPISNTVAMATVEPTSHTRSLGSVI